MAHALGPAQVRAYQSRPMSCTRRASPERSQIAQGRPRSADRNARVQPAMYGSRSSSAQGSALDEHWKGQAAFSLEVRVWALCPTLISATGQQRGFAERCRVRRGRGILARHQALSNDGRGIGQHGKARPRPKLPPADASSESALEISPGPRQNTQVQVAPPPKIKVPFRLAGGVAACARAW
jgi:hypothetical protein